MAKDVNVWTEMYELDDQEHYYLYTDGKRIFVSKKPAVKREGAGWYHPDIDKLKCVQAFYLDFLEDHKQVILKAEPNEEE